MYSTYTVCQFFNQECICFAAQNAAVVYSGDHSEHVKAGAQGPGGGVGPDGTPTDDTNDDECELGSDVSVPKYISDL